MGRLIADDLTLEDILIICHSNSKTINFIESICYLERVYNKRFEKYCQIFPKMIEQIRKEMSMKPLTS